MPSTIFNFFVLDSYNNPVKMAILMLSFQSWGCECPGAGVEWGMKHLPRTTEPVKKSSDCQTET